MRSLLIIMEELSQVNPQKSTSFALLLAAQRQGWVLHCATPQELFITNGTALAHTQRVTVQDQLTQWFQVLAHERSDLREFDLILMRQDPPVDQEYWYVTQVLDLAIHQGVLVSNHPPSVRAFNEKLFSTWFPDFCPPHLVSCQMKSIQQFIDDHQMVAVKTLDSFGGSGVYQVRASDPNRFILIEHLTQYGTHPLLLQRWIPEITQGDKRILLLQGEPVAHVLVRIPAAGDFRGNMAADARIVVRPIQEKELALCHVIGPTLQEHRLDLVGLDVIGDQISEINVTSPTGIREIDQATGSDIGGDLLRRLER